MTSDSLDLSAVAFSAPVYGFPVPATMSALTLDAARGALLVARNTASAPDTTGLVLPADAAPDLSSLRQSAAAVPGVVVIEHTAGHRRVMTFVRGRDCVALVTSSHCAFLVTSVHAAPLWTELLARFPSPSVRGGSS